MRLSFPRVSDWSTASNAFISCSEAYGNLIPIVGNPQINSAVMICVNGRIDVEHVKRDIAPLTVNAD